MKRQVFFCGLALVVAVCGLLAGRGQEGSPGPEAFDEDRFEKEVLVPAAHDPVGMDVLPDGRVLFIERPGNVRLYRPDARRTVTLGTVPVAVFGEVGLMGAAADPHFARTGWVYLFFCPAQRKDTMRLSR